MGYDNSTSAKSDVGLGGLNNTGDNTRLEACFLLHKLPIFLMVGLVGTSQDVLLPVLQSANPASPTTLILAVTVVGEFNQTQETHPCQT